jgi:GNAT superfamily N-acetyltransferase
MAVGARHFDRAYRESVKLSDGETVELRLVQPEDASLLLQGFERFSPASRYKRFLSAKQRLSDEEVRYLTCVDGENHFAIGAVRKNDEGKEEGLAIARFVRFRKRPDVAEAAIAVLDAYQSKGLGKILLSRLVEAARERGIDRFEGEIVRDNVPVLRLVRAMGSEVNSEGIEDSLNFSVPIVDSPDDSGETALDKLRKLLRQVARGGFSLASVAELLHRSNGNAPDQPEPPKPSGG